MSHPSEFSEKGPHTGYTYGISGDFSANVEPIEATTTMRKVSRVAHMSEIADKIASGIATDEEEALFIARLSAEVAQGYN